MCQFQYCCPHSATTTTVWLNFWRKRITPHHSSYDHKSIYMSNEWICVQHTSHTRTTAHSNQAHQAHTCTKHTTGLDKFCVCAMCHVPCVCVRRLQTSGLSVRFCTAENDISCGNLFNLCLLVFGNFEKRKHTNMSALYAVSTIENVELLSIR